MNGLKKHLIKQMVAGIDAVKLGLYARLSQKYNGRYGEKKAGLLAAAVTNELFSETSSNAEGEKFLMSNIALVERELYNLRKHKEICKVVTQAVRVKILLYHEENGETKKWSTGPLDKLKKFGILVEGGETPRPDTFLPMVNDFYQGSVNKP